MTERKNWIHIYIIYTIYIEKMINSIKRNNLQLQLKNKVLKRERKGDKGRQIVLIQGWLCGVWDP